MTEDTKPLPKYHNPEDYYREELEDWRELWDEGLTPYENICSIINQSVVLPNHKIQLPIAATYLFTSSKWAKILPILFSWGDKGTGKSTFAILAAKLHGHSQLFSAADTFASIRNGLDSQRWLDAEDKSIEKEGAILCWDNIHADTLKRDPKIFQMLLFGYNRSSERILVANIDGTNREYRVFSPKIFSSVHPIHTEPEFEELKRRLLIIRHKQFEKFLDHEKSEEFKDFSIATDRLDLDSVNWAGFEDKFFEIWNKEENFAFYAKQRVSLTRRGKKSLKIPENISGERWTILIDLICTGLVIGAWPSVQAALNILSEYFAYIDSVSDSFESNLKRLLRDWISEQIGQDLERRAILEAAGIPVPALKIAAKPLKNYLDLAFREGALERFPKAEVLTEFMRSLGWRRDKNYWIEADK